VIISVSGAVTVNGTISSAGLGGSIGNGAGGSVNITAGTFAGSGTISANGGAASYACGGGGRVAVKLTSGTDFGSVTFQAFGGAGTNDGGAGTVYKEIATDGAGKGELIIDNNGGVPPTGNVTDISLFVTDTTVGSVTLSNNGELAINGQATSRAILSSDVVDRMWVTNLGTGYTIGTTPTVSFSGGGGSGAAATATVSGMVTGITITNGGSGYTSATTITLSGGGATTSATAQPVISSGVITGIILNSLGKGYTSAPTVNIADTDGGSGASATAEVAGFVVGFTVTDGGSGYTSAPTVTLSGTLANDAATLTVNGPTMTVGSGCGFANRGTLAIAGDTTFDSVVGGAGSMTLADASGGTFSCTTAGTTLSFTSGDTFAVPSGATCNIIGVSGNNITLTRSGASDWLFDLEGTYYIDYVTAGYSDASSGNTVNATRSTESPAASCTNWDFSGAATWDGSESSDWHTAANWTGGSVPSGKVGAVIPTAGVTNEPTISSSAVTISSLTIESDRTLTCEQNLTVNGAISNAGTLYLKGVTLNNTDGSFSNTGTLKLKGGETFTGFTMDVDTGTTEYVGDGDSAEDSYTINNFATGADGDYYNLTINPADSQDIFVSTASQTLKVAGDFTFSEGTFRTGATAPLTVTGNMDLQSTAGTFDNSTNNNTIGITGNVTMDNTQTDMGDATWTVSGNFDNKDVGTFNGNTSTLVMDGASATITGGRLNPLRNLTISGAAIEVVAGTDIRLETYAVTVDSGKQLTLNQTLRNTAGVVTNSGTISIATGKMLELITASTANSGEFTGDGAVRLSNSSVSTAGTWSVTGACSGDGNVGLAVGTYSGNWTFTTGWDGRAVTFNGNVTFNGAVTFNANNNLTVAPSNNDLEFLGHVTLQESGGTLTWTPGSGTITLSGTAAQDIDFLDKAVEDIVIDKADGTVTLTNTSAFTTDSFDLKNGTVDFNGKALETTGDFTIGAGGQVVGDGLGGSTITVGGALSLRSKTRICSILPKMPIAGTST